MNAIKDLASISIKYCANVALMFVLMMTACRKQPAPGSAIPARDFGQGKGRCRLSHVAQHTFPNNRLNTGHLYFTYDSAGRLQRVANINTTGLTLYGVSTNFKYKGDTIFATHDPKVIGDDIIVLNQRGQIAIDMIAGYPDKDVFTYDQAGQLVSEILSTGNMPGVYYTWANWDMVKDSSRTGHDITHHYYVEDRLLQYGSPEVLEFYATWGVPLYKTKHLQKACDGYDAHSTVYAFDDEGKIIADTVKDANGTMKYYNTFEYECL